ncbi:hypothetical protein T439DRAFT_344926 [Meredithblackwellia eburnea MCA 4105]
MRRTSSEASIWIRSAITNNYQQQSPLPLLPARNFTSSALSNAPPPKKPTGKPLSPFAKKRQSTEDESATSSSSSSQGIGNVLNEVTLPPPNIDLWPEFYPENVRTGEVGRVHRFAQGTVNAFKAFTLPKTVQKEFAFVPTPSTVLRSSTVSLTKTLDAASSHSSKDSRLLLAGSPGSGKSILLLQAASYALSQGWIVLYLPSATPLINSSTPHVYSPTTKTFDQPVLSRQMLDRFLAANRATLRKLKTQREYSFGEEARDEQQQQQQQGKKKIVVVPMGSGLDELATTNAGEASATEVFKAVLDELSSQTTTPVLLAIDEFQPLLATSLYVDPSYKPIESYSLEIPRLLLQFIDGSRSFAKGSVLLSASSHSPHQSLAVERKLDGAVPDSPSDEKTGGGVYDEILARVRLVGVPDRLERREAVGIAMMVKGWRGNREALSDTSFLQHYVAADGNPRHFSRELVRTRQL